MKEREKKNSEKLKGFQLKNISFLLLLTTGHVSTTSTATHSASATTSLTWWTTTHSHRTHWTPTSAGTTHSSSAIHRTSTLITRARRILGIVATLWFNIESVITVQHRLKLRRMLSKLGGQVDRMCSYLVRQSSIHTFGRLEHHESVEWSPSSRWSNVVFPVDSDIEHWTKLLEKVL